MEKVQQNVLLAPSTTLGVGGKADFFLVASTKEELRQGVQFAKANELPVRILGGGSNILVPDEGVKGLVIKNEISGINYSSEGKSVLATVGGGVLWDDFVYDTVKEGYWGLENLSSIPGTVGATPVQNVGAYGVEVGEFVREVEAYDSVKDSFVKLSKADCCFGYRDSYFKTEEGRRLLIVSVTYILSSEPKPVLNYRDLAERFKDVVGTPSLLEIRDAVIKIRSEKFPDTKILGTAGSFFKNPIINKSEADELLITYPSLPVFSQADDKVKVSLGFILDKICGLRGYAERNVGLYEKQALVLINMGGATADDVKHFASKVSEKVFEKTKIKI